MKNRDSRSRRREVRSNLTLESLESRVLLNGSAYQPYFDSIGYFELGDDVSHIMIKDMEYTEEGEIVITGQGFYGGDDYFVFVSKIEEDLSDIAWTVDLGSRHLGDISIDSTGNIWIACGGDPVILDLNGNIKTELDMIDRLYFNPTNKGHYWSAYTAGLTLSQDGGAYAFARLSDWDYNPEYPDYPINQQSTYGISHISADNDMEVAVRFDNYDSYKDYYPYSDTVKIISAEEMYFPLSYEVDKGIYTLNGSGELQLVSGIDYDVIDAEIGSNGDYFSVGYTTDSNYRDTAYVQRYDGGSLNWTKDLEGASATAVDISSNGTVYVFGLTSGYGDYSEVNPIESNFNDTMSHHVTAYSASGSLLWSSILPVPNDYYRFNEFATGVIASSSTGMVALAATGETDADEAQGKFNNYISIYTVSTEEQEAPTGELAENYDEVGYAITDELNEKGYLDLILNGAEKNTVTGDELELGGSGAESVSVSGKPKLIDAGSNTYRYTLSGEFSDGTVSVTIPGGSFENSSGIANAETVAVFASFPDLKLLDISIEPTEFSWDSSDSRFEYTGTVSIGPDATLTGGVFSPVLTLDGSLNINKEKLSAEGVVTTSIAGSSQGVMNGSFEILIDKDQTYYVQDTDAAVASEISIAGQELRYSSMKIGVSSGASQLDLQGDIKLPTEFGANAITLTGNQYLSLKASGQSLNGATMTFDDVEIDLPYLNLTAEQLSVEYVAAAGTQPEALRLRGKVVLPEVFDATADFTTDTYAGTDGYIEVSAAGIKWYGKLSIGEIVIVEDQWVIKEASLEVRDVAGVGMSVQGDGIFTVPPGMDIICGLGFVNEELNYVKLGVDGIELPIGTTGAFLQSINGYVNNIADKDATNIQFGGGLGFTAGKKIEISLPDWAGGDMEGALAEFAVDGGFTFQQLTGSGTVKIAGGLVEGAANATLNWEKGTLTSACTATALNNLLTINGTMNADSKMNMNMIGTGSVTIPSIIPIWGGQSVGNGTTVFKFTNDDNYGNDYAAGWGTTSITAFGKKYDFTVGIKVNLNGSYSFLGGKSAAQAQAGVKSSLTKAYGSKATNSVSTAYTAEEDAGWLLINASWDSGNDAEILLTAPDGTVYDQAAIDGSDNITVVGALSTDGSKVILIDSPDAGSWTLTVQSNSDLGNVDFNGFEPSEGSEVTIDSVVVNPYTSKTSIEYSGGAEVSFYYDTDSDGADGILIGTEPADGSYSWDTSSVAAGTYYVYATTAGEGDVPFVSYYAEPIVIDTSLPTTEIIVGTGGASKVQYTESDGTVVTLAVKSATATLSFIGDNIDVAGSKTVVVSGDNLLLQEIIIPDSTSASSIAFAAKGGSDNMADIGDIISGSLKSISGKGVNLIGNIGVAGSLASFSWGDIADNSELVVTEAGSGCVIKANNIGDNVEILIMDTVKSVAVQSFSSGEVNCQELGKFSVKEGDVEVDIMTTTGGIGGIAVAGDLSGEILAFGPVTSVASKSGTISSYIISYGSIGKVSAYAFDQAAIYGDSVGSVSCKGDFGTCVIITTDGDLGAVKATGDIDLIASINGSIKSISTKGDISGRIDAANYLGKISANNMAGAKVCCLNDIGTVSLKGDMLDSWILSGYSLGDDNRPGVDDLFGSGDIKSVSVKGIYSDSIISAGKLPDISAFADIDNVELPYELGGSISSVKFGSVVYDADSVFGVFAADGIKSVKDGKANAETYGSFVVG